MKRILVGLLFMSGFGGLFAQSNAMDWTRTECSTGTEHHLFAELDSGYVIMIDFVMMNCAPCITATNSLRGIYNTYQDSHPGRVRLYSVGFNDFTSCEQMIAWKLGFHFTHPMFEKGGDETIYYGGIGMPTVIVLGGGEAHTVYYNHFGYDSAEDALISAAIDQALAESIVSDIPVTSNDIAELKVSPNPFTDELSINIGAQPLTHLVITDLSGRECYRREISASDQSGGVHINAAGFPHGILMIAGYNGSGIVATQKVMRK